MRAWLVESAPSAGARTALLHVGLIVLDAFRNVVTGRKMLSVGGKDDHLDGIIGQRPVESCADSEDHFRVDRVIFVGARQDNARDTGCRVLITDKRFGHGSTPSAIARARMRSTSFLTFPDGTRGRSSTSTRCSGNFWRARPATSRCWRICAMSMV